MSEHVVREVLRRLWIPEYSDVPFRQADGSHELTDGGLKVYFTGREYDEDRSAAVHRLDACVIGPVRLQGLLRYIVEAGLAPDRDEALTFLIRCTRESHDRRHSRRVPLFLALFVLLTVVLANLLLAAGRPDALMAYLHSALIVLHALGLVFLLLWGHEATAARLVRDLPLGSAEEYFHALCGLAPQLERIAAHRLCGVSKPALLALAAWLVIAVALPFIL